MIQTYELGRQLFADDSGLYDTFRPNDPSAVHSVENIEACCRDVKSWMVSNMLKLNDDKTEPILFGPKNNSVSVSSLCVGDYEVSTLIPNNTRSPP